MNNILKATVSERSVPLAAIIHCLPMVAIPIVLRFPCTSCCHHLALKLAQFFHTTVDQLFTLEEQD